jgi:hypothetical protein
MKEFFKRLFRKKHVHQWQLSREPMMNKDNGCEYSVWKCECGKVAMHKQYPDGEIFKAII